MLFPCAEEKKLKVGLCRCLVSKVNLILFFFSEEALLLNTFYGKQGVQ